MNIKLQFRLRPRNRQYFHKRIFSVFVMLQVVFLMLQVPKTHLATFFDIFPYDIFGQIKRRNVFIFPSDYRQVILDLPNKNKFCLVNIFFAKLLVAKMNVLSQKKLMRLPLKSKTFSGYTIFSKVTCDRKFCCLFTKSN